MPYTYISDQGQRSRDYNMDAEDAAQARAKAALGTHDMYGNPLGTPTRAEAGLDVFGNARPENVAAYNQRAAQANVAAELDRQSRWQALQDASQVRLMNTPLIGTGKTPEERSASLAKAQYTRAAASVPGGADLYQHLNQSGYIGENGLWKPMVPLSGNGEMNSLGTLDLPLSDPKKESKIKPLPGMRSPTDMLSDERFRTLMAYNPAGAKNFYKAVMRRGYDEDKQAEDAALSEQHKEQTDLVTKRGQNVIRATADNPKLGIKKGDYVERQIVPGLLPGQFEIAELPLVAPLAEAMGIAHDPETGEQILKPSMYQQATGLSAVTDIDRARQVQAALNAKKAQVDVPPPLLAAPGTMPSQRGLPGINYGSMLRGQRTTANAAVLAHQQNAAQQSAQVFSEGFAGNNAIDETLTGAGRFLHNRVESIKPAVNFVHSLFGGSGDVVSQPNYMSPEQYQAMAEEQNKANVASMYRRAGTSFPAASTTVIPVDWGGGY